MPKITPFLWFNDDVEDAMTFYLRVFPEGCIVNTIPGPDGTLMGATFELCGQQFMGLNGGPLHQFTHAISMFVSCKDQQEVDHYWSALTAHGGQEDRCGWLKDKFGLSWQIVPDALAQTLGGPNPEGAGRAMQAMMGMKKLIVADLLKAYAGSD